MERELGAPLDRKLAPWGQLPFIGATDRSVALELGQGLRYAPGFVLEADELLTWLVGDVDWQRPFLARAVASFGVAYNYSGVSFRDLEMPPAIASLADDVEARIGYRPNNCLLNLYETGASSMGFHADATDRFTRGSGVTIITLGAARDLVFRRAEMRREGASIRLEHGSLLQMSAALQRGWQHAVPRLAAAGPRISVTFRSLR